MPPVRLWPWFGQVLEELNTAYDRRPEVITGAFEACSEIRTSFPLFPFKMKMLHFTHSVIILSSLVLLAKEHNVSVVDGVISFASEVDGWSLDIFIPRPVHPHG